MKNTTSVLWLAALLALPLAAAGQRIQPTLYQQYDGFAKRVEQASSLDELLTVAEEWDQALRQAVASLEPGRKYLSDRDRASEFVKDQALSPIKDKVEDEIVKRLPSKAVQILKMIPSWISIAAVVIDVSAPSAVATDKEEMLSLDPLMQEKILKRFNELLPPEARDAFFSPIRDLKPPGATIRMP